VSITLTRSTNSTVTAAAVAGAVPTLDRTATALAEAFHRVDRNTSWRLTDTLRLDFPTFHTQGMAITPEHIFLSSVEVLEPTALHPTPRDGHDRSVGQGIGHLFVIDHAGNLQQDIMLGEGDRYHPGGIDYDGTSVWVPVAEYRPHSSTVVYRVNADTLEVSRQFEVPDHLGGVILDTQSGHLVGNTWGSRRFGEWNLHGRLLRTWENPSFYADYQDGQYAGNATMLCAGVTALPQTPTAGGLTATYELGGIALIDLTGQTILREVPFQRWSTAGHVVTRNPFTMAVHGNRLIVRVAPDNGDEGNGTEILTYEATVPR